MSQKEGAMSQFSYGDVIYSRWYSTFPRGNILYQRLRYSECGQRNFMPLRMLVGAYQRLCISST